MQVLIRVFISFVSLMSWGPTDRVLIHLVDVLLPSGKQLLMKPPHAYGPHLAKNLTQKKFPETNLHVWL